MSLRCFINIREMNTVEGSQLLPGEILVAVTTNVGWIPLFPCVAAIITDIDAPLSHAATVARVEYINACNVLRTVHMNGS